VPAAGNKKDGNMLENIGGFVSHTSNLVTKNSKQTEESKFGMKK
jgi:hypothetical protein